MLETVYIYVYIYISDSSSTRVNILLKRGSLQIMIYSNFFIHLFLSAGNIEQNHVEGYIYIYSPVKMIYRYLTMLF